LRFGSTMPLTDRAVKQALPTDKDLWLTDAKGLRLLVKKNGSNIVLTASRKP